MEEQSNKIHIYCGSKIFLIFFLEKLIVLSFLAFDLRQKSLNDIFILLLLTLTAFDYFDFKKHKLWDRNPIENVMDELMF